jgi:predicted membrane channel-forming protein YqfA (hemolysin III family)
MFKLYKTSLIISIAVTIIGAMFKIMHWPEARLLLSLGLLLSLIYIVIALIEIYKTESKTLVEKVVWLIGFIVFSWIVGLIYYFVELKPKYKIK